MIARLGAALPAMLATPPPASPPTTCPAAQAMLERPAANPWCRRLDSAISESIVKAGVKQIPPPSEVRIRPAMTSPIELPIATAAIATAQMLRPTMKGVRRPARSE